MSTMQQIAKVLAPVLSVTPVRQMRRNHALEHATIHMLNRQRYVLSGRSSAGGFVIYGDVPTEKVGPAVEEALTRLRRGQRNLAVHPNCGTNLVTTGFLATVVGGLGFMGTNRRSAWERFPIVMAAVMMAVLYSMPLGMSLQRHITTDGDPGELELVSISRSEARLPLLNREIVTHHVITRRG